jgi:hypothetical protein
MIEIERADRTYVAGESIAGRVVGTSRFPEGLVLVAVCRSGGYANSEAEVAAELALHPGHESAFRIQAPASPPSFVGHIARWEWFLEARTRGGDVAASLPIQIRPPSSDLSLRALREGDPARTRPSQRRMKSLLIQLMLLGACGFVIHHGLTHEGDYWIAGLIVAGFALLPTAGTVWGILSARKIGNAQARVVHDGDALACTVWLAPTAQVPSVDATLRVRELTQREDTPEYGPERREHVIHESTAPLTAVAERPGEWAGKLSLAIAALPPSVSWPSSQISWAVHIRIGVPGLPADEQVIPLVAASAPVERPAR